MANKIKIKLVRSPIGGSKRQRLTVKGLGLKKLNHVVEINDTPALRGMVQKIPHLVQIIS